MKKMFIALLVGAVCMAGLTACTVSGNIDISIGEESVSSSQESEDADSSAESEISEETSQESSREESETASADESGEESSDTVRIEDTIEDADPHKADKLLIISTIREAGKADDFMYEDFLTQTLALKDKLNSLLEENKIDASFSIRQFAVSIQFNDNCGEYDYCGYMIPELFENDPAENLAKRSSDSDENEMLQKLLEAIKNKISDKSYYSESVSRRMSVDKAVQDFLLDNAGPFNAFDNFTGVYGTFSDGTMWGFSYDELEKMYMEEQ